MFVSLMSDYISEHENIWFKNRLLIFKTINLVNKD